MEDFEFSGKTLIATFDTIVVVALLITIGILLHLNYRVYRLIHEYRKSSQIA